MRKTVVIVISVGVMFTSCRDIESCGNNPSLSFMTVQFFDKSTKVSKKVGFSISPVNQDTVFQLAMDSLSVGLSLNSDDTVSAFIFDTDTTDYVLRVRYDVQFAIFDPACDPTVRFSELDTLSSTFDSTTVTGRFLDRQLSTNIEVYF